MFFVAHTAAAQSFDFSKIKYFLGERDAVLVADPEGNMLFAHNPDKTLIPASLLKLLTALTAFEYLGENYRFQTEFYIDRRSNLKIKGYGDPLLISEAVAEIAKILRIIIRRKGDSIANIVVDHSFYDSAVVIPGVTDSTEPYDAPNGALCVNFNTVKFKTLNGVLKSAEPQTPLLPVVLERIEKSGLSRGRITLSHHNDEIALYAGHLFKYFLERESISVDDSVKMGKVLKTDRLIFRHRSIFALREIVSKMMEFSNNYVANQILINTGTALFGSPGTLAKGVAAADKYAQDHLHIGPIQMAEGSGISRKNRMSARSMLAVLERFKPFHELLRFEGDDFFKTGTLKDIRTRAGYIRKDGSSLYPYVILLNSPGKSARMIVEHLRARIISMNHLPAISDS